jgi:hypothetical protein
VRDCCEDAVLARIREEASRRDVPGADWPGYFTTAVCVECLGPLAGPITIGGGHLVGLGGGTVSARFCSEKCNDAREGRPYFQDVAGRLGRWTLAYGLVWAWSEDIEGGTHITLLEPRKGSK